MDSAGDLPTYRVREIATEPQESAPGGQSGSGPAGGTTTGRRPSAGRAVGLNLRRHQRGDAVKVRLVVRHAVRLITLSLKTATGRVLASRHMTSQPAGSHTVALQLDAAGRRALRRAGRLKLTVRMLVVPATGGRIITERSVTLDRPASR
jgi:hypothetical protein